MKNPAILHIPTLTNADWCDNDVVMFHACFGLLEDCVKNEKLLTGHINWEHNEEHVKQKIEIEKLYNWWKERIKLDKQDKIRDLDKEQYEKDDEMLIRLIKIRRYLWT